ncbi:MAG: DUF4293 domain-containing protein [Rikenella sp.]|nr:DUF4293 domain-containing protein [Rikenella sp.]
MLQRIQTVHLLVVVGLLTTMLFSTFATIRIAPAMPAGTYESVGTDSTLTRVIVPEAGTEEEIVFDLWSIRMNGAPAVSTLYMSILVCLTLAVAFVTIFLYRNRWLQVRLCLALAVMLLGIEAFIILYIYKLRDALDTWSRTYAVDYSITDLFPIVALLFVYFAYRGISKDIALIKSLDRIR